jgi:hypothetical protein
MSKPKKAPTLQRYLKDHEDEFLDVDYWDYGGETGSSYSIQIDYDALLRAIDDFSAEFGKRVPSA